MSAWIDQMFKASAANGGVVRRARRDVVRYSSVQTLITEAKKRGFHVVETGGQLVVLCHTGVLKVHC